MKSKPAKTALTYEPNLQTCLGQSWFLVCRSDTASWRAMGVLSCFWWALISSAEFSLHWKNQPGLPSALICTLGTGLASFALFALVFPLVWLMNLIAANNLHNSTSTPSLPHMQDLRLSTPSILQARQTVTLFVIHRLSFLSVYGYSLQWSFSMTW